MKKKVKKVAKKKVSGKKVTKRSAPTISSMEKNMRKDSRMNAKKKIFRWFGIVIFAILIISYFIPISYNEDYHGITKEIHTTLLGEIIFNNGFVLALYLLLGVVLILRSYKRR